MANSYGVSSKVFRKERQKYRFEEKHFLFFTWHIKIPVDSPKNELIVFIQENDNVDTVRICNKGNDDIVVKL